MGVQPLAPDKLRPCLGTNCEAPEAKEKMTPKMQLWHSLFQYYRHLSIKVNKYNFTQRWNDNSLFERENVWYLNPTMKNCQDRFPGGDSDFPGGGISPPATCLE